MTSLSKVCFECGMPISLGVANCSDCGAKVGTVFDETAIAEAPALAEAQRLCAEAAAVMKSAT